MLPGEFDRSKLTRGLMLKLGMLGIAGGIASLFVLVMLAFVLSAWFGRPLEIFSVFGFNEGPTQPIAFPHDVHVNKIGLDCTFCHRTVTEKPAASVPSVGLCMTCHKALGGDKEGVQQLRQYYSAGQPIDWIRVHRVPDHVRFVHEAHIRFFSGEKNVVNRITNSSTQITIENALKIDPNVREGGTISVAASQVCSTCHGDVASMPKVKQIRPLKMADCVNCHRDNNAPTDCTTCHY